ncbi:MAG: hypothetical protein ACK559_39990 [bacterium]
MRSQRASIPAAQTRKAAVSWISSSSASSRALRPRPPSRAALRICSGGVSGWAAK